MPEKQDKSKSGKKPAPKKAAVKPDAKTNRGNGGASAKKKPRSRASRKKHTGRKIIALLVILCLLLLGFNLFLVSKLLPDFNRFVQTGNRQMQAATPSIVTEEPASEGSASVVPAEASPIAAEELVSVGAGSTVPVETPPIAAAGARTGEPRAAVQTAETQAAVSPPAQHTVRQKTPVVRTQSPRSEASAAQSQKAELQGTKAQSAEVRKDAQKAEGRAGVTVRKKSSEGAPVAVQQQKMSAAEVSRHTEKPAPPLAKPEKPHKQTPYAGTLIFVFDDAGHNLAQLEHFLRLPFPCTIAVLPRLRYSSEAARRIRKAGKQVILHQPMQSVDLRINPGEGAITPGLSAEQIKAIVEKNLEEIWPVAGMNNHEGSLITADEQAMRVVLKVAAEKRIFFLDSRTTAQSVVPRVAKELNMTVWERAIFIDNDKNRDAMEAQIKKGLSIARRTGSAIMIGHVFTVELAELLTEMYPALIADGFSLSTIAKAAQKGMIE